MTVGHLTPVSHLNKMIHPQNRPSPPSGFNAKVKGTVVILPQHHLPSAVLELHKGWCIILGFSPITITDASGPEHSGNSQLLRTIFISTCKIPEYQYLFLSHVKTTGCSNITCCCYILWIRNSHHFLQMLYYPEAYTQSSSKLLFM